MISISKFKQNPDNPRTIKKDQLEKLKRSIKSFPEMMEKRPMVCVTDEDGKIFPLGGNMRLKAIKELGFEKIKKEWVIFADEWTEEQRREFIVKDNASMGSWDFDALVEGWNIEDLDEWGVKVPTSKNTELLSELTYDPLYYQPKKIDDLKLIDAIDFTKFNEKIKALEEYDLSDEEKEVLKMFAYRFLKIDFEQVANYYFFHARDEEQKAIERLRLVLTDAGINGFIEDDLLRVYDYADLSDWEGKDD
jgi:hypothetical protein